MTTLAQQLKHGAGQAWESLSEGWRELGSRASSAMTRFWPGPGETSNHTPATEKSAPATADDPWFLPARWSFMAADVYVSNETVTVRIEAPGMQRDDFRIELTSSELLTVTGHKRVDRGYAHSRYALLQAAYGTFRRDIRLPVPVDVERAKATYEAGVLRLDLPRREPVTSRRIEVRTS